MTNDLIKNFIEKSDFEIVLRSQSKSMWESSLSQLDYVPIKYTNLWLDFQFEILNGNDQICEDISMIFFHEKKLLAIWPISLNLNNKYYELKSFSQNMFHPVFAKNISNKLKKKLYKETIFLLSDKTFLNQKLFSESTFLNSKSICSWAGFALNDVIKTEIEYDMYLDLSPDMDEILRQSRKSLKSSITKAKKELKCKIIKQNDPKIFNDFKKLHFLSAGYKTRSDLSWQILFDSIEKKQSFLSCAYDKDNELVGTGLFFLSKDECEYAVAAYNRSLFDKPIGQLVQLKAIEEMKKRNLKFYRLGRKSLDTNKIKPTDKERTISLFKDGFASFYSPILINTHSFD
jgi:FemAB family protein